MGRYIEKSAVVPQMASQVPFTNCMQSHVGDLKKLYDGLTRNADLPAGQSGIGRDEK
jgi:hypothetical protein